MQSMIPSYIQRFQAATSAHSLQPSEIPDCNQRFRAATKRDSRLQPTFLICNRAVINVSELSSRCNHRFRAVTELLPSKIPGCNPAATNVSQLYPSCKQYAIKRESCCNQRYRAATEPQPTILSCNQRFQTDTNGCQALLSPGCEGVVEYMDTDIVTLSLTISRI